MKKIFNSSSFFKLICLCLIIVLLLFFSTIFIRGCQFSHLKNTPKILDIDKQTEFDNILNQKYPQRNNILQDTPFASDSNAINLLSKSAIVINVSNGDILYEKNANEIIPPASLLKLVQMYIVLEDIHKQKVNYDDIVPLPEESWAASMPPHSSLMFLGRNQKVTLSELLLGLSIASGNDASYAIAHYISGNMAAFIDRMNAEAQKLGLTHSYFIESSGYSESNKTTAKEMATIIRDYLSKYPEVLQKFHNQKRFTYPQKQNLAPEDINKTKVQDFTHGIPENIYTPITQKNTNPLLGLIEGVDGVKTGYIDESGYNLAMTINKNGMRILAVTMGGPGNNLSEGNATRIADSKAIIDYIYKNYTEFGNLTVYHDYVIPTIQSKSKEITLTPAFSPKTLTVTNEIWSSMQLQVKTPFILSKSIEAGQQYGSIEYYYVNPDSGENEVVLEVPLVAKTSSKKACLWVRLADNFAKSFIKVK